MVDVIVYSLGDATDTHVHLQFHALLVDAEGSAVGAVAAYDVQLVDAVVLEEGDSGREVEAAAGGAEEGAAFVVDVGNEVGGEDQRVPAGCVEALVCCVVLCCVVWRGVAWRVCVLII